MAQEVEENEADSNNNSNRTGLSLVITEAGGNKRGD